MGTTSRDVEESDSLKVMDVADGPRGAGYCDDLRIVADVPVPERPQSLRPGWWSYTRALTAVAVAMAIVAGIGCKVWWDDWFDRYVGPQHDVAIEASSDRMSSLSRLLATRQGDIPLVLNYHNITPSKTNKLYDVTAANFKAQMALLAEAGYVSLTAQQYVEYLNGEFEPKPNSFLLTFDDGASGTFRYADRILAEHSFNGVVMLISGSVSKNPPYYLTWQQIRRMEQSGRWSFASHSALSHTQVKVRGGSTGSAIANRLVTDEGRETLNEMRRRVRADFDQVAEDFDREGVQLVPLFAWPFSQTAVGGSSRREHSAADIAGAKVALQEANRRYVATFTNVESPVPATDGDFEDSPIERLEIRVSHTLQEFVDRVMSTQELPPDKQYKLPQQHPYWTNHYADAATPARSELPGEVTLPEDALSYLGEWAVAATHEWESYEVKADVGDVLSPRGTVSEIRLDTKNNSRVTVRATRSDVSVFVRASGLTRLVERFEIDKQVTVTASVRSKGNQIRVVVGDNKPLRIKRPDSSDSLGPLAVYLEGNSDSRPVLQNMSVRGGK